MNHLDEGGEQKTNVNRGGEKGSSSSKKLEIDSFVPENLGRPA